MILDMAWREEHAREGDALLLAAHGVAAAAKALGPRASFDEENAASGAIQALAAMAQAHYAAAAVVHVR